MRFYEVIKGMWAKVGGSVSVIGGLAALIFTAAALIDAREMSASLALTFHTLSAPFDQNDWLLHWRLSCSILGVAGIALTGGGIVVVLGRRSGLPIIAFAAAALGGYPWALGAMGFARYGFEAASALETLVFLFVVLAATFAYIRSGDAS